MVDGTKDKTIDWVNTKIDDTIVKKDRERSGPVVDIDEDKVIKVFPYFIAACLLIYVVLMIAFNVSSVGGGIKLLCLAFVIGFMILGAFCVFLVPHGAISRIVMFDIVVVLVVLLWAYCYITDDFFFNVAISKLFSLFGVTLSDLTINIFGFMFAISAVCLVPIAVCTVVSTYLRKYVPILLRRVYKDGQAGKYTIVESFFQIPRIINVKDVVLEPPVTGHIFRFSDAMSIATYNFILCVFISSYIFLNPLFLDRMDDGTMLIVAIMLSSFVPVLILIWQVFRIVGAKVVSEAPRKYDLWFGAKNRLYSTFMALGLFMTLAIIIALKGYNLYSVFSNYLLLFPPLLIVSLFYGVLYANNFADRDVKDISDRFEERMGKDKQKSE